MFSHLLLELICKNIFAKASSTHLVRLLQVPDQNERVKGMETGWSDDQP